MEIPDYKLYKGVNRFLLLKFVFFISCAVTVAQNINPGRGKVFYDAGIPRMDIPAARANHVKLYINEQNYGVYINVEHIDEVFVDKRFGNNNGNLYKCLWPAPMIYLGEDPDLYKYELNGRRAYDLKTNKAEDDYSDLSQLISILNNTNDQGLACELEKVMNVNSLIKAIAVEVLFQTGMARF